jgi:hypothetical protein
MIKYYFRFWIRRERMEFEHKVDRDGWPAGEWDDEPDYVSWTHQETDMACLMVRNWQGSWCGYVAVEEGHPLYERQYEVASDIANIEVHGGLTFGDFCHEPICHVPEPGKPDKVWWLGFDCGHAFDLSPGHLKWEKEAGIGPREYASYKNQDYCKEEVEKLAVQLRKAA